MTYQENSLNYGSFTKKKHHEPSRKSSAACAGCVSRGRHWKARKKSAPTPGPQHLAGFVVASPHPRLRGVTRPGHLSFLVLLGLGQALLPALWAAQGPCLGWPRRCSKPPQGDLAAFVSVSLGVYPEFCMILCFPFSLIFCCFCIRVEATKPHH